MAVTAISQIGFSGVGKRNRLTAAQGLTSFVQVVDLLVIAGGGGGGYGGGGAGGLLNLTSQSVFTGTTYTVTIGAGGSTYNVNGNNSQFGSFTAAVAGGAGGDSTGGSPAQNGKSGGSGGGAYGSGSFTGASGTAGQGNKGGDASGGRGAGGGGAGAAGGNESGGIAGAGGAGSSAFSSWGSATSTGQNVSGTYWYAGGGAGYDARTGVPAGGNGGGGAQGYSGQANTGGGGGAPGQSGGSGLVIVRFSGTYTASATTGSPTRTVSGGYTYYHWTGNGSITI